MSVEWSWNDGTCCLAGWRQKLIVRAVYNPAQEFMTIYIYYVYTCLIYFYYIYICICVCVYKYMYMQLYYIRSRDGGEVIRHVWGSTSSCIWSCTNSDNLMNLGENSDFRYCLHLISFFCGILCIHDCINIQW